jgi:peptidoglycan hydrolase-like protein with peptidoglycan-binding domain
MAKVKLTEQTIEDALREIGSGDGLTLSELRLAIVRVTENEPTAQRRARKTREFLGMLADQLELPGLFTLPNGRFFVYKRGDRYVAKDASPEYMTAEEAQPVADRNLIPEQARTRLEEAGIIVTVRAVDEPPDIAATALPDTPVDTLPAEPTGGSALERFANSGKGGLRNDPDEVDAINELQEFLVSLGLDVGNNGVDGRYGSRTTGSVRRFQSALTDVEIDGDAGPETIGKIVEIRTDLARMQELIDALNESALPVKFKSGLAQLLERDLTQEERTELQNLLDKYEDFRQEFPSYNTELFSSAENAVTGATDADTTTGTDTDLNWEEITVADEATQDELGVPVDAVILEQGLGAEYIYVFIDSINGREFEYVEGSATGTPTTVTAPEGLVYTINQEIERRESETPAGDDGAEAGDDGAEAGDDGAEAGDDGAEAGAEAEAGEDTIEWAAPFNTADWPADSATSGNEIRGTDRWEANGSRRVGRWIYNTETTALSMQEAFYTRGSNVWLESEPLEWPSGTVQEISGNSYYEGSQESNGFTFVDLSNKENLRNAIGVEAQAAQQQPADAGDPIPDNDSIEEFKQAAIDNIRVWLQNPGPTVENTEEHLRLYRLPARTRQELEWLDTVYSPLPLKLARSDLNYDFDGTRIRLEYRINTDNADVVQQWIREELRPALQAARRETPAPTTTGPIPPEARTKAQTLYDAMSGMGVNRAQVEQVMLRIASAEEYEQIDSAFRQLSDGESLWSFIDSQMFFSTVRIEDHLRSINVNYEATTESEKIINITKRLLER